MNTIKLRQLDLNELFRYVSGVTIAVGATGNTGGGVGGDLTQAVADTLYYSITNPDGYVTETEADAAYYPLVGNPSSFASVSFVTGASGVLQTQITQRLTQSQADALYYSVSNPSGYVTSSQTGTFYPASNPSGYNSGITESQANALYYPLNSNPSGYVTGLDVGSLASVAFVTGVSGSLQTQIDQKLDETAADLLYYSISNPDGFIDATQTGNFYPRNNPSGYIGNSDTGAFYPSSNPSGFIGSAATGTLYPNSNPSGFISGLQRGLVTYTSSSLAPEAVESSGRIYVGESAILLTLESNRDCWVRFYATPEARTDDLSRTQEYDPEAGIGVLGEFVTAGETIYCSPTVSLLNMESPPSSGIPITITNLSLTTGTVTLTARCLVLE